MVQRVSAQYLTTIVRDARAATLAFLKDIGPDRLMGPKLDIVNPLLWEIGHVAWFQERFVLRQLEDRPPILANADALYDSMRVAHDDRWDLPLPSLTGTLAYLDAVSDALLE